MKKNEKATCKGGISVSDEAKYQIFISSTYTDLRDQRQAVIREVIRAEQFPIAMEHFVASNKNQWDTIERFLRNSGCLILLLGERYGTTDENDENKRSFTEKEFDLAEELNIPILAFILAEPVKQDDSDENEKYMNFKKKIEKNRLVCHFRNCDDLSGAVAHSIALEKSFFINPWYRSDDVKPTVADKGKELSSISNANYWDKDAVEMFDTYKQDLEDLPHKWDKWEEWKGGKDFKFLFEVRSDRQVINDDMQKEGITKSFRYVYTDQAGVMWVKGWYL